MSQHPESFAIIGIGCRLPGGAESPEAFWRLLYDGIDAVSDVPSDRWDMGSLYDPDYTTPGRIHQRHGGFIDQIRHFDAKFFGISPKEAIRVDPQQRLLLEAAYNAMEDSGYGAFGLAGTATGVFVGISTPDYNSVVLRPSERRRIGPHTNQGVAPSIAANRISYTFDLRGPSVPFDTACSSSITALHFAIASLRAGDCDLALVGGVTALLSPYPTIGFSLGMYLSGIGRCHAFGAKADGFVRSEGVGVVVLKPVHRALADGDRIYAVVRHTGVNDDGRTDGMAMPSVAAQAALLRKVYRDAGIDPLGVGYMEAHGTGTVAGDAVEAHALGEVLGRGRVAERPLLVGSVKTNVGHLEAGAGAVGLIKLALSIHHRHLPRSLHADDLNPTIPFDTLGLEVVRFACAWPDWNQGPIAGLNSFGFGGANAHAILTSVPQQRRYGAPRAAATTIRAPVLTALSARTEQALRTLAERYLELDPADSEALADIGYASITRRDHHPIRALVVAREPQEWRARIAAVAQGRTSPGVVTGHAKGAGGGAIAFICPGQGPQFWSMARVLFQQDPCFKKHIREIDAELAKHASWSLIAEIFESDEANSRVEESWLIQPALYAVQIALWRRFADLGITPAAVVGHSVGEVAAAVISGALTFAQGAFVVYHRARIQQEATGSGKMIAVGLSEATARQRIAKYAGRASIAAVNRPELVTVAGNTDTIDELYAELTRDQVYCRPVRVRAAFHSHLMEPLAAALNDTLGRVVGQETSLPWYSTVTGREQAGTELRGDYWYRNVRQTVQFVAAIRAMLRDGYRTFIELSPHPILGPGVEDMLQELREEGTVLSALKRGEDDVERFFGTVGTLYCRGDRIAPSLPGSFVPLPLYPWQREEHWNESDRGRRERLGTRPHPLVSHRRSALSDGDTQAFTLDFDPQVERWFADHRLQGEIVAPGAALLEAALACGRDASSAHCT